MNGRLLQRIAAAVQAGLLHGWLVIDRDFRIICVNDAFCNLWGKSQADLVGQSVLHALFDGNKKDKDDNYHGPLIETMDTGVEFPMLEACISNHTDNSYLWYLASTVLLRDEDERPEYAVGVYVGIDKFKCIEKKLDSINVSIIRAFCRAIGLRDEYTKQHSENVASLMVKLAEFMKLSREAVTVSYLAGIVHDVGKIGVPERILNKPGRLTHGEYESVKRHAVKGADILSDIDGFEAIASIVRHHHERYDGTGYPAGLGGETIPLYSRMLSVCDAYDAMTTERCYREPYGIGQALREINRCSGTQFDPEISRAFVDFVSSSKHVDSSWG